MKLKKSMNRFFSFIVFLMCISVAGCRGSVSTTPTKSIQPSTPTIREAATSTEPVFIEQDNSTSSSFVLPDDIAITPDGFNFQYNFKPPLIYLEPHDDNCGQFEYLTKMDISSLTDFYKTEMPRLGWNLSEKEEGSWTYGGGQFNDNSNSERGEYFYYFEKRGRKIGVFIGYNANTTSYFGGTTVAINALGWYWSNCIKLPVDVPTIGEYRGMISNDFVVLDDPSISGTQLIYRTTTSIDDAADFYKQSMPGAGWSLVSEDKSEGIWNILFKKPGRQSPDPEILYRENVTVTITPEYWGGCRVRLSFK